MAKHRDVMSDPFALSGYRDEAPDPMSGLTNLADCMLVLACGLMVALVVHWNLNMTPRYEVVEETGEMMTVDGNPQLAATETKSSDESDDESEFENMGTLYKDVSTGKLYYVRDADEA